MMYKKHVISPLLMLCLSFALTACGDDYEDSYAPQYGNMVFNPTRATPGDSVKVTVEQARLGHGLEKTTYTWSIKYGFLNEEGAVQDTIVTIVQKTNYDGYPEGHDNPSARFLVPENCESRQVSVTLNATFSGYIGNTLFLSATKGGTLSVSY